MDVVLDGGDDEDISSLENIDFINVLLNDSIQLVDFILTKICRKMSSATRVILPPASVQIKYNRNS